MLNISLQQIEYFLTVAECNYFSEAANLLYVSQPAVSKWIGKLEKELGVTLFIRSRDGVTLTDKGKYLYSVWRPVFNTIAKSVEDVRDFGSNCGSTLRIGCIPSVEGTDLMRELVMKYKERFPDVAVKETIYELGELNQRLVAGAVDIAVSSSFALEGIKHIVYKNISGIDLYLAVSAESELAQFEDEVPVELLRDKTFFQISHDLVKGGSEGVFAYCINAGFYPKRIEYVPNLSSLAMNVRQDRGVAICGKFQAAEDGIKFFPIEQPPNAPFLSVAWRPDSFSVEAQQFVSLL